LNVSLCTVRRADFYVPFYPARDFHGLAALELGGDVKTVERIVNPDAILSRVALHGGAIAGKYRGGGSCAREEEEDSQSVGHFVSRMIASGVRGTSEGGVAKGACPDVKISCPKFVSFKGFSLPNVPDRNNCTIGQKTSRRKFRVARTKVLGTKIRFFFA